MSIAAKIKPTSGLAHFFHILLKALIPALVYIFVQLHMVQAALALILLSKWRMLAVRPRHWPANIRSNSIDVVVGVSFLIFMLQSGTELWQLVWAIAYGIWLIVIKPRSSVLMVSLQAMIGQFAGLMALFLHYGNAPSLVLVSLAWIISYSAARHFFTSFDEPSTRLFSYTWAYFAAALIWLLSHWLLFYGVLAQPTLLLSVIGLGLMSLYYLEKTDRLSAFLKRQFVFIIVAVVVIVIAFSDWGDKTV